MNIHIDRINNETATSLAATTLNFTESSVIRFLGRSSGPIYPRLDNHEAILIRTLAIADNLDEVMMLPQGMVFPLRTTKQKQMRRKVNKAKSKDRTNLGKHIRDQEEEYQDIEDYQ